MRNIKRAGIPLVLLGLGATLVGIISTPAFAVQYISPDHSITAYRMGQLQAARSVLSVLGVFITMLGTTFVLVRESKLREISNWLIHQLQTERVWIGIIIVIGFIIRFFHLIFVRSPYPFYLGGLFLEFAEQIAANGFRIPQNIPFYTNGGIPFAYPPLPFYVEALAVYRLGLDPYAVVNNLPPLVAVLTLPSFYVLTRVAGLNQPARLIAFTAFALMPNAFVYQIEGGGLSESFGTLALIWFLVSLFYTLNSEHIFKYQNYLLIGVAWTLCVVSSPGSAYASVLFFLVFSIAVFLRGNPAKSLPRLALAGITALTLSSPYWLSVASQHGFGVFLVSFTGQHAGLLTFILYKVLAFQIVEGTYAFVWNFLVFVGIVFAFTEKKFFLLALLFILAVIPRESHWMLSIPSALLVGIGAENVMTFLNNQLKTGANQAIVIGASILMLGWAALGPLTMVMTKSFSAESFLDSDSVEAMHWLRVNSLPESKIIVLADPNVQEWLPHISERTVVNMPYGSEWKPSESHLIANAELAMHACQNFDCVYANSRQILDLDLFLLFADNQILDTLSQNPNRQAEFKLLWENDKIAIGLLCKVGSCS